ncbi:DASH family cryptochrome [Hyphobacterium sp. CCMP332]|nr:DASH family cryptochrome [Hyphobacterium sp. CCMP332]
MNKRALVWFRNDLRISDNEALYKASAKHDELLCLYCFDPRNFENDSIGLKRTGSFRANFLIQSVFDLKASINSKGGELCVVHEKPEDIIPKLCKIFKIQDVYFHEESGTEELQIAESLENILFSYNINTHKYWGSTLFHKDDLPFPVNQCPDVFSSFRKQLEKEVEVRAVFPEPRRLNSINTQPETELPSLFQLGLEETPEDTRTAFPFEGGESAGMRHLNSYIWDKELIKTYKETRNGLIGTDYSSKFSPWLANGSLSPRVIFQEIKKYESQKIKNKSTYWLVFELIWRDFFNIQAQKLGSRLFKLEGAKELQKSWQTDEGLFEMWKNGMTGIPFIDANMLELKNTGFMSNRGRQNVASFLTKDLNFNWLWGAQYFESMLIDHDVCSNYGNWQYVAGVGADPREDRYFNVLKQSLTYDQKGNYIRKWIPELSPLSDHYLHRAFVLSDKEKKDLGLNYPSAHYIPQAFKNYIS